MLNYVIISKDFNFSRYLINCLNSKNDNLRMIGLLAGLEELYEIIKITAIDIILINSDCIDYKSLNDNMVIVPYLKSTILISNKIPKKIVDKSNVYAYINKEDDIESIVNIVNKLVYSITIERVYASSSVRKNAIINAIENELKYLNLKVSYTGVKYLIDAIYILYNIENYYDFNLEKDIYSIIAQKYHKKVSNIKSNITYTVNMLYIECEEKKLLEYLDEYSICKPSPKRIILAVLKNIKKESNCIKI